MIKYTIENISTIFSVTLSFHNGVHFKNLNSLVPISKNDRFFKKKSTFFKDTITFNLIEIVYFLS